jgi:murein tripeptide amidase MpaA
MPSGAFQPKKRQKRYHPARNLSELPKTTHPAPFPPATVTPNNRSTWRTANPPRHLDRPAEEIPPSFSGHQKHGIFSI